MDYKMNQFKVKLFNDNGHHTDKSNQIRARLNSHKIKFSEVFQLKGKNYIIDCNSNFEIDRLFTPAVITDLKNLNCFPKLNLSQKSDRTFILKNCDDTVYANDEIDIKHEIEDKNPWIKIKDIYKIPRSKLIKICPQNIQMANKALLNGICLYNISHPAHKIERETYIEVKICLRCYALDQHATSQCNKSQSFQICSQCSSNNHYYKQCSSSIMKCINCKGNHNTMAFRCPARKAIVKYKREGLQSISTRSYANITLAEPQISPKKIPSSRQHSTNRNQDTTNSNTILTSVCLLIAQNQECMIPGTFEKNLNWLLKNNNLPPLKLPALSDILPDSSMIKSPATKIWPSAKATLRTATETVKNSSKKLSPVNPKDSIETSTACKISTTGFNLIHHVANSTCTSKTAATASHPAPIPKEIAIGSKNATTAVGSDHHKGNPTSNKTLTIASSLADDSDKKIITKASIVPSNPDYHSVNSPMSKTPTGNSCPASNPLPCYNHNKITIKNKLAPTNTNYHPVNSTASNTPTKNSCPDPNPICFLLNSPRKQKTPSNHLRLVGPGDATPTRATGPRTRSSKKV